MIVEVNNLVKSFGRTQIIRNLNLSVQQEEILGIIGPNGAGKSTLFNLITGLYKPTSGGILLKGEEITADEPYEILRKGLSRSFQIINIFPKMTVFENIQVSLLWSQGYGYSFLTRIGKAKKLKNAADDILHKIGMHERRDIAAGELSYAEQRLLEIGITISSGADVILLDEPMAGLSKEEVMQVSDLIVDLSQGKTIVMIEHDMEVIFSMADRISVLVYGEIIATGTPEMIKDDKRVQEAYLGVEMA